MLENTTYEFVTYPVDQKGTVRFLYSRDLRREEEGQVLSDDNVQDQHLA